MKCCIIVDTEQYQIENSLKYLVCLFSAGVSIGDYSTPGGAGKRFIETSDALALT